MPKLYPKRITVFLAIRLCCCGHEADFKIRFVLDEERI